MMTAFNPRANPTDRFDLITIIRMLIIPTNHLKMIIQLKFYLFKGGVRWKLPYYVQSVKKIAHFKFPLKRAIKQMGNKFLK